MRRGARWAAWSGLIALEGLIARTYFARGTWWHYLLHMPIGLGLGLAAAALASLVRDRKSVV